MVLETDSVKEVFHSVKQQVSSVVVWLVGLHSEAGN